MNKTRRGAAIVIMAAGKGTRMESGLPKALLPIAGRPMLSRLLDTARAIPHDRIIVVVGHKRELVIRELAADDIEFVTQEPQLGTAHAVAQARGVLSGFEGDVLTLSSDVPLIRLETIGNLLAEHRRSGAAVTVLTFRPDIPSSYGRIIRENGDVAAIVEAKDASPEQLAVREVNSGVYVFKSSFLFPALGRVGNDNVQKEYYLTDLVNIAAAEGQKVAAVEVDDPAEVMGANTIGELAAMEAALLERSRA